MSTDQADRAAQAHAVGARDGSVVTGQNGGETHPYTAGHDSQSDQGVSGPTTVDAQFTCAADALVLIAADVLDDLERIRIATENRLRSLTSEPVEGERGGWFGKGLSPDMPEVRRVDSILDGLRTLEHQAENDLKRAMRKHPLGDWVKRTVGVGEKQAARLLAAIGDPGSRRTVSQLWAYCGYHVINPGQGENGTHVPFAGDPTDQDNDGPHGSIVGGEPLGPGHRIRGTHGMAAGADPLGDHPGQNVFGTQEALAGVAPKRRRGQKANWSSTAKMRAFLVAESCIKQVGTDPGHSRLDAHGTSARRRSPYRDTYDAGRAKYAEAVHAHACERCGPSGKPAPIGSPLSDGHKHARAMRLVAKAILRDLWVEARRLAGQGTHENQSTAVGEAATSVVGQTGDVLQGSAAGDSTREVAA